VLAATKRARHAPPCDVILLTSNEIHHLLNSNGITKPRSSALAC
jgi:hypothetical protein